jgi:hypothetical protein
VVSQMQRAHSMYQYIKTKILKQAEEFKHDFL